MFVVTLADMAEHDRAVHRRLLCEAAAPLQSYLAGKQVPDDYAIAVMVDLVDPFRPVRDAPRMRGQTSFDETGRQKARHSRGTVTPQHAETDSRLERACRVV
jgi:hypothetical protein